MSLKKGLVFHAPLNEESEKVGSELVTNGDVSTSGVTTNWTAVNATLTAESNGLKVADNGPYTVAYQAITTIVGKTYILNYNANQYSTNNARVGWGDNVPDGTFYADNSLQIGMVEGHHTYYFVATSTTTYLSFGSQSTSYVIFDNMSLKEVETADATPQGNHGVVYGATQNSTDMSFDGTDDYIKLTNLPALADKNEYTISLWANMNNKASTMTIYAEANTGNDLPLLIIEYFSINNSWRYLHRDESNNLALINSVADPDIEKRYHLVAVRRAVNDFEFYVDNVSQGTDSTSVGSTPVNNFNIGRLERSSITNYIDMNLNNVKIYNRALTSSEIEDLYKLGGSQRTIDTGSLKKGLVLDMPLREVDEKVGNKTADNTPNSNHGLVHGATQNTDSMSFDGTNDYVDTGEAFENFKSFSSWIYIDSFGTLLYVMGQRWQSTEVSGDWGLRVDDSPDNVIELILYDPATNIVNFEANVDTWYHVVGVADGTNLTLYIDGEEEDSIACTSYFGNSDNTLTIGRNGHNKAYNYFDGLIKDARLYNRVLTSDEITKLYKKGL